ncbi:prolyl oligopeptidase family serine peptidase [Candidatus Nomurabacteria bacterium]|nr:prolyl oligopeptidase family serine peptidase [Candidatus Nomurabacteria bacterium]
MKDNLEKIRKLPLVLEARRVFLKEISNNLVPELFKKAKKSNRNIFVYKIIYKSQGHKVVGYIIEPSKGKKLPNIIWNRGGSNNIGAIKLGQLFTKIAKFAEHGYITIATQYSGGGGSEGRDEFGGSDIKDVLNLYKILKGYKRSDISNIGMYGISRGGLMTYLSLARVKWIKAAVVISAPTDQLSAVKFREGWKQHQIKMYGGSLKESKKRSPIFWIKKFNKKTPLLIMHGSADWRVNPKDSILLAEKLYKKKIPYRLIIFEGGDHALSEYSKARNKYAFEWFDRFLKKEKLPLLVPHGK